MTAKSISIELSYRQKKHSFHWLAFFPSPLVAHDAQSSILQSFLSGIIHVSAVTVVRTPELVGSNPAIDRLFLCLYRYSLTRSYFQTTNFKAFRTIFFGFLVNGFFFQKLHLFRRN